MFIFMFYAKHKAISSFVFHYLAFASRDSLLLSSCESELTEVISLRTALQICLLPSANSDLLMLCLLGNPELHVFCKSKPPS